MTEFSLPHLSGPRARRQPAGPSWPFASPRQRLCRWAIRDCKPNRWHRHQPHPPTRRVCSRDRQCSLPSPKSAPRWKKDVLARPPRAVSPFYSASSNRRGAFHLIVLFWSLSARGRCHPSLPRNPVNRRSVFVTTVPPACLPRFPPSLISITILFCKISAILAQRAVDTFA